MYMTTHTTAQLASIFLLRGMNTELNKKNTTIVRISAEILVLHTAEVQCSTSVGVIM